MSDELDFLFQRLRGQRPPRPFAVPEAVRRRGRQRSRHQAVAAGLAVAAMAGGGGAGLATVASIDRAVNPSPTSTAPSASPTTAPLPSGTPGPPPSASPSQSTTPLPGPGDLASRMLRAADLGPGSWQLRRPYEPYDSGELWRWTGNCPEYNPGDYASLRAIQDVDVTGFALGPAGDAPYVFQHLHRYRPGWGPRALDDVRRVVSLCRDANPTNTLIGDGFAGDESLLVRVEFRPVGARPFAALVAVVRVGDLVADIEFSPDRDEAYAKSVATAAAKRLAGG